MSLLQSYSHYVPGCYMRRSVIFCASLIKYLYTVSELQIKILDKPVNEL